MGGKAVFAGGIGACLTTIAVVLWIQRNDKAEMRKGVERDLQRIKANKAKKAGSIEA